MITKYIKGDVTKTTLSNILNYVNCINVLRNSNLVEAFPEIRPAYEKYASQFQYSKYNQAQLLGEIQSVKSRDKKIYNAFVGYDNSSKVNYKGFFEAFKRLTEELEGSTIAIEKRDFNGNWALIEDLINDIVEDKLEIWVYEF